MSSTVPKIPNPVWPAWGPRLLESDVDYDIADFIDEECGFDLHRYWRADKPNDVKEKRLKDARDQVPKAIGLKPSQLILNSGLFTRLFDKYKACGPDYKKYGGKYFTVLLCALSFRAGANISKEQREYARSIYQSAGLFKQGIKQFGTALDKYVPGKPYDFKELGLQEMLQMKAMFPFLPGSQSGSHHGPRFFEAGKPTTEAERAKMDRDAPMSCSNCGKPKTDLSEGQKLLRCGECWIARYCSKECQTAEWKVHKKGCYTPEEQQKRAESKDGPGSFHVMLTPDGGIKHVISPISPEEMQADQFIRSA